MWKKTLFFSFLILIFQIKAVILLPLIIAAIHLFSGTFNAYFNAR